MENDSAILELYDYVQMNKTNSKEYTKLLRKFIQAREEFDKTLIDEQKENLEKLLILVGDVHGQEFQEYFIARIFTCYKINDGSICEE